MAHYMSKYQPCRARYMSILQVAFQEQTTGSPKSNSLVPVGELHHHIQDREEKQEVEEAVAVRHMVFLVIMDLHPTALIIVIDVIIIIKSLVLLLSCGGIRTAGITAPNRVSLSAMGEHTNTH